MALMGWGDLQNARPEWRQIQPLWNLMTQNPFAHGDRAMFILTFALACNDQHQTLACGVGAQNEIDKLWMRFGHCHPVQINASLWFQFATGHLPKGFCIHL